MAVRWINQSFVLCLKISIMPKMTRFSYIVLLFNFFGLGQDSLRSATFCSKNFAEEYKLDTSFYKKATYVQDILIATSDKVSDYAHLEAAYLYDQIMSSIDKEAAQRIRDRRRVLCISVGHDELTSQIPQFKSDKTGKELDFYNWRSRGFLTKVETEALYCLLKRMLWNTKAECVSKAS